MSKPSVSKLVPRVPGVPGASRRQQYSASTKRALVDVAEGLFTDHGYANTSLDAIVAGARVTKGAARISATLRELLRTRKRRVHSSDRGSPAEELTARAFVPPSSDRVASQQIGTAAIVSRAASRNESTCASVTSGDGGIVVDMRLSLESHTLPNLDERV